MTSDFVVDSSALLTVLLGEPEADTFLKLLQNSNNIKISSFTWLECIVVISVKKGPEGVRIFREFLSALKVNIEPFTPQQAEIAYQGWTRFGKGWHPASLNLGDCVSYAVTQSEGLPLLFKGNDFSQTDVAAVLTVLLQMNMLKSLSSYKVVI